MYVVDKILKLLKDYADSDIFVYDISSGVFLKRFICDKKVKFKTDENIQLPPKDFLNIKNIIRKKVPILLDSEIGSDKEMILFLASPFYAYRVGSYKEEIFLLDPQDLIETDNKVKLAELINENDLNDDSNYMVIVKKGDKIVYQQLFYCDKFLEYQNALNNASFSHFLDIIYQEDINNEKTLISCLAKNGIPPKIQDQYLDYWYDYNEFHNIVNDICLEIERHKEKPVFLQYSKGKSLKKSVISYLKYDISKANELLESLQSY